MKKYTTILFDADDTLLDFNKDETQALLKTLKKHGVPITDKNIATYKEINVGLWKALERGEIDKPTLKKVRFSRFFEKIGAKKAVACHFGLFDELDPSKVIDKPEFIFPTPFKEIVL